MSTEFEAAVLPHLDAAYNLARYLTRNPADAEDVVQEAVLRAATYFGGFRGVNPRAWLLQIVRNTAYASRALVRGAVTVALPGEEAGAPIAPELIDRGDDPETALRKREDHVRLRPAARRLARRAARDAGAARDRGAFLQGDRRDHAGADRHGDVAAMARAAHSGRGRARPRKDDSDGVREYRSGAGRIRRRARRRRSAARRATSPELCRMPRCLRAAFGDTFAAARKRATLSGAGESAPRDPRGTQDHDSNGDTAARAAAASLVAGQSEFRRRRGARRLHRAFRHVARAGKFARSSGREPCARAAARAIWKTWSRPISTR